MRPRVWPHSVAQVCGPNMWPKEGTTVYKSVQVCTKIVDTNTRLGEVPNSMVRQNKMAPEPQSRAMNSIIRMNKQMKRLFTYIAHTSKTTHKANGPGGPIGYDRWLPKVRLPLVVAALIGVIYYTAYSLFYVPVTVATFFPGPANRLEIKSVVADTEAALLLQADDQLLAVDGQPVAWPLQRPLYTPGQAAYTYTIDRDGTVMDYTIPVPSASLTRLGERIANGVLVLLGWLVGSLVLLLATPQNKDGWQLGLTTLAGSVILAAVAAAEYGVPGAWLLGYPWLPWLSVALVQLALLPRQHRPSSGARQIGRLGHSLAIIAAVWIILETSYLETTSWPLLSAHTIVYGSVLVGWTAHLGLLGGRYMRMTATYERQQVAIIGTFTAMALLPIVFLIALPRLFWGISLLPWSWGLILLALLPTGYGYAIYRQNYLGLDVVMTKMLTTLFLALLFVGIYSGLDYVMARPIGWATLAPLPMVLVLLPLLVSLPYIGEQTKKKIEQIIYGSQESDEKEHLAAIGAALARKPEATTLCQVVKEVASGLQIEKTALLLTDNQGQLRCVDQIETVVIAKEAIAEATIKIGSRHHTAVPELTGIWEQIPWADYLVPLTMGEEVVGLWLLGCPVPAGYLNDKQIGRLREVATMLAVAVETVRLFDASRAMSRDLLRVADTERMQVAARIHDAPLQQISMMASHLKYLAQEMEQTEKLATTETEVRTYLGTELVELSLGLQEVGHHLRHICAGLHPPFLKQGAQWAIGEAIHQFEKNSQISVVATIDVGHQVIIPYQITAVIYYILQEALHNVSKHAAATLVSVSLTYENEQLRLCVADNGQGNVEEIGSLSHLLRAGHQGLAGMYEWADTVAGKLTIETGKRGGVTIQLSVPFTWSDAQPLTRLTSAPILA